MIPPPICSCFIGQVQDFDYLVGHQTGKGSLQVFRRLICNRSVVFFDLKGFLCTPVAFFKCVDNFSYSPGNPITQPKPHSHDHSNNQWLPAKAAPGLAREKESRFPLQAMRVPGQKRRWSSPADQISTPASDSNSSCGVSTRKDLPQPCQLTWCPWKETMSFGKRAVPVTLKL